MVLLRFYSYLAGNGRKWEENMLSEVLTRVLQHLVRVVSASDQNNAEISASELKSVITFDS